MAEPAIDVRALSLQRGARTVLRDISFEAHFGEVLAVLGPNGAGKSSLLRGLSGLCPYQGDVRLSGRELRSMSTVERARAVSFVPQQSQLTAALPVASVVAQGRYMHRDGLRNRGNDEPAVAAALEQVDMSALRERPFSELSCGEQKRVLLARALCSGARVLLLDEPTASLDIEHALRLSALLRTLAGEGRCIVVVLHQLDEALQLSDRALLLKQGRTLTIGASAAVIDESHVRALYGVELLRDQGLAFRLPEEDA
jgi:iron complex transport system ATP-binding protein